MGQAIRQRTGKRDERSERSSRSAGRFQPTVGFRQTMVALLVSAQLMITSGCHVGSATLGRLNRFAEETHYAGTEPCTGADCAVECLAENIDWLEHHIDTYGSIVAKQPDIWGEARLTKHRDEYERILYRELTKFQPTINASIAQTDSSFLAQALALSAAASGEAPPLPSQSEAGGISISSGSITAPLVAADDPNEARTFSRIGIANQDSIALEPVIQLDQLSRYVQHLHELRRINEGDDTSDSPGYSLNLVRMPVSVLPGKLTRTGFGAEVTVTATPVLSDDLMATTFRNLAVNDVVDLLGLPLVRATEAIAFDRLPATVARRTLDTNMEEILTILQKNDRLAYQNELKNAVKNIADNKDARQVLWKTLNGQLNEDDRVQPNPIAAADLESSRGAFTATQIDRSVLRAMMQVGSVEELPPPQPDGGQPDGPELLGGKCIESIQDLIRSIMAIKATVTAPDVEKVAKALLALAAPDCRKELRKTRDAADLAISDLGKTEKNEISVVIPTGRARRALNPLNPTFVIPVLGLDNLVKISEEFRPGYQGRHIRWNGGNECGKENVDKRVDLLDARRYLQAEIEAAYELLREPAHVQLLHTFAAPNSGLAKQIRSGHLQKGESKGSESDVSVEAYRSCFFRKLHEHERIGATVVSDHISVYEKSFLTHLCECERSSSTVEANTGVEALAWAIVVESALLNERLNQDVRKVARAKGAHQLITGRDYSFFLPDTVLEPQPGLEYFEQEYRQASEIFKEYVAVRWPIHVFAIDPREQDQNVADVSARKRELQFALALGFVTGQIGVNSLTQFSRDLQTQIETISLNRTVVGFGHGNDTFGWRFQPRVQALHVPGTFGAIAETLCGTSRDYDLAHRKLEPGQRECVAVVLMPSFVPYADFDVRTNWYKLTNPKNAALTMKDTVHLSRAITAMRQSQVACVDAGHLYRDGEVSRLMKRITQLDRELPLQTMRALVPYENTLGGFEMFNTGVTDLSPELIGWYGAPGIDISSEGDCGCYQGCRLVHGKCNGEECTTLNDSLIKLQAQVDEIVNSSDGTIRPATPLPVCEGAGTSIFLVGDNFSVHDTRVIAGGVCIPHVQLISRELMRVTIPHCVDRVELCENGKTEEYVSIYVATPYGVTNHLHVPVHTGKLSKSVKEQVEAAASAAAKDVIKPLQVVTRPITVKPKSGDTQKLHISAILRPNNDIQLSKPGNVPSIVANVADPTDPLIRGKKIKYYAAIQNSKGQFLTDGAPPGGLVDLKVDKGPVNALEHEFKALGENSAGWEGIEKILEEAVDLALLSTGSRKQSFTLVYFAEIGGHSKKLELIEELDVEITLDVELLPPANISPDLEIPKQQRSDDGDTTDDPAGASSQSSDCDCNRRADAMLLRSAYNQHDESTSGAVIPAQFAEVRQINTGLLESNLSGLAFENLDPVKAIEERLADLQTSLREITAQQVVLQSALDRNVAGPTTAAGAAVVNVRVVSENADRDHSHKADGRPLFNQTRVGLREHWRNLRDHLEGH